MGCALNSNVSCLRKGSMEYVGEIALSESQERILDSVMPGGEKWGAYKVSW